MLVGVWTQTPLINSRTRIRPQRPLSKLQTCASATTSVDDIGFYTWGSAAVMVGDVQSWVDSTASNFGWIPIGNETEQRTSKRFDSSEMDAPAHWPLLTVSFTSPGDCNLPLASDLNNDCTVDFADFAIVASEGLAGRTPLQLAEQRGNTEIVGLLRNHGAK